MLQEPLKRIFILQFFCILLVNYSEERSNLRDSSNQNVNLKDGTHQILNLEDGINDPDLNLESGSEVNISSKENAKEYINSEDYIQEKMNVQITTEKHNFEDDNQEKNNVKIEKPKIRLIDTAFYIDNWKNGDTFYFASDNDDYEILKAKEKSNKERGFDLTDAEMQKFKIWKEGVIPYFIDVVSFSDKGSRDKIRSFLHSVNSATGLSFMELPNPPSDETTRWVFFLNRRSLLGCADHTVKNFSYSGVQQVVLGYDCMATKGELGEAVMSIVGVPAQHNAPNRDDYITINMENIMPDKKYLFEKLQDNEWLFHDLPYDFQSVSHYGIHKYSANGRATITPKDSFIDIDPATSLTATDNLKIRMLYNFISSKKKLQVPKCKKLFRPGKGFHQHVPDNTPIKPRKKPSKYSGIPNNDDPNEDIRDQQALQIINGNNEDGLNTDSHQSNSQKSEESTKEQSFEDPNIQKLKMKQNTEKESNEDLPKDSSDYDTNKKVVAKLKNKKHIDPLSYFSDYNTGDETDRKKVLQTIQHKTLSHIS